MTEKQLSQAVMTYLRGITDLHPIRIEPGPYGGMKGVSDILACYKGQFIAIELKIGTRQTTRLQDLFLRKIRNAGGIACVCRSVDDVAKCLMELSMRQEARHE